MMGPMIVATLGLLTALAAPADDARFLRRVSLDVLGVIPTEDEVERFLAGDSADKRTKLVDAMLSTPDAAARFGREQALLLLGAPERMKEKRIDRTAFSAWLARAFESGGR